MATTQNEHNGNGTLRRFSFTFPYIKEDDVKVSLRTSTADVTDIASTTYTFPSATEIQFSAVSETDFQESTGAPKTGVTVRVFRDTDLDTERVTFFPGSSIRAQDLNDNTLQNLYASQERQNRAVDSTGGTMTGDLQMNNANIVFEGSTENDFETTLTVVDPTADRTITLPDQSGTVPVLAVASNTQISATPEELNTLDGITSTVAELNIMDGVTATTAELNTMDGITATTAELNTMDGITATVAELNTLDGITSTVAELNLLDGVTSSTAELNLLDGVTATTAEINTLDGVTATTAELNLMDGVTATTAEINHVDGVTSNVQTQLDNKQPLDAELTELATMSSGTASALADLTGPEVQTIDGVTSTTDELNILDGVTATAAEINILDGVTSTAAELNILDGATVTATELNTLDGVNSTLTAAELNQLDGNTLTTSATWTSDTQFPSAANIDARITARIDPIGGYEAIADEDSFPATAPPEGTIISIANAGGMVIGASATTTDATRAGGTDAVTIQNIPTALQSQTVQDGLGMLVVATSTAHTYDFHRVVATDQDVIGLSQQMDDFAARYRVGSTLPTDGLCGLDGTGTGSRPCDGDMFFNTGTGKMLVYDGDSGTADNDAAVQARWEEVQSIGNFKIIPATELADFADGSADEEDITDAPTSAEQIILSINGVIQEPQAGSSAPTDGFALDGSTIRLSATPPNPSEVWGVIIGSAVNIGTPSNNTVDTAQLVDDGVTNDKLESASGSEAVNTNVIRDDAVTAAKLADSTDTDADRAVTRNHIRDDAIDGTKIADDVALGGNPTTTTQTAGNNTTRIATTAFVTTAVGNISQDSITNGTSNVSVANNGDITATRANTVRLTVNNTGIEVDGVANFDSTDAILLPAGTTAQRSTEEAGSFRYNTTLGSTEYYNGTNWILTSTAAPTITSITGNIIVNTATTLTINGSDFGTANLDVRFVQAADSIDETVTVTPTSQTAASVAVPANVRNNVTNGNVVTITVENEAGLTSDGFSETAIEFPSGGTVTTSGDFRIHTFTSSGTFANTIANLDVEYLIIAGGGGGGADRGGGGGAGGYRTNVSGQTSGGGASAESSMTLTTTGDFTVTVGAGGAGGVSVGGQGGDSTFNSITSSGGGLGRTDDENGADGGSGAGGGGGGPFSGGSGTSGQGFDGADSASNSFSNAGSSGGGAGSAGTTTSGGSVGSGGAGVSSNITGTAVTRASGGGGGSSSSSGNGTAQAGGGAAGGNSSAAPSDATANTGGGGGGASFTHDGSAGGSGIVIIRYDTTTI